MPNHSPLPESWLAVVTVCIQRHWEVEEEEAGRDADPDAKINTETGSDKRGKAGELVPSPGIPAILGQTVCASECCCVCGLENGAIESKQASPNLQNTTEGCIPSACDGQTPEGPSAIFLLHESSIWKANWVKTVCFWKRDAPPP